MKVGILTYHRTLNYGAFLQAYSLKIYVQSLGHEVSIIDWWPEWHFNVYRAFRIPKKSSLYIRIKAFVKSFLLFPWTIRRIRNFERDIVHDLGLSKRTVIKKACELEKLDVDLLIYGSDQIWRYNDFSESTGFDPVYFGDFVPQDIKKVAYAASMGIVGDFGSREWLLRHFEKFSALSVRESELSDFVSSLVGTNVPVVLDPVFLNTKEFWIEYSKSEKHKAFKNKYVLFYNLIPNEKHEKIVQTFAAEKNLCVIELTGQPYLVKLLKKNCRQTSDVKEFLNLIQNAEYIFSSSFHGVAFSILLEKQFFALDTGSRFGRVASLLKLTGLESRKVSDAANIDEQFAINWKTVNESLQLHLKESKEFLFEHF